MLPYIIWALLVVFAGAMFIYTLHNDPDSLDPKWDMDKAPWRKKAPWEDK